MSSLRRLPLALAAALALAAPALADDAPVDLHAANAEAKPVKPAAKTTLSRDEIIAKANAWFEDSRMLTADFVQIAEDGTRSEGNLYVVRPGRLLFHFNPPSPLEVVADGRSVAVRDQNLGTQDLYFIAQTPLKFLLSDHIDLGKDLKVKRVAMDDHSALIEIIDNATFGGKSDITLLFDPNTFALKQWTVVDAQGYQTVVTLFDIDLVSKPDPALFHIDESVPVKTTHHR